MRNCRRIRELLEMGREQCMQTHTKGLEHKQALARTQVWLMWCCCYLSSQFALTWLCGQQTVCWQQSSSGIKNDSNTSLMSIMQTNDTQLDFLELARGSSNFNSRPHFQTDHVNCSQVHFAALLSSSNQLGTDAKDGSKGENSEESVGAEANIAIAIATLASPLA